MDKIALIKFFKALNLVVLAAEIFGCIGTYIGFDVVFGHGLGDVLYYAILYAATLAHLFWTFRIWKTVQLVTVLIPVCIFTIFIVLMGLKATIWRGPEYSWRNREFFFKHHLQYPAPTVINDDMKSQSIDSSETEDEQGLARKEFISQYDTPLRIDTAVTFGDKKYDVVFIHSAIMDSSFIVPARYYFDTHSDFIVHPFFSTLIVHARGDTLFKKDVKAAAFGRLLDTTLQRYATLLYPVVLLKPDSISIRYSISIPVTDIGIPATITFDYNGNQIVTPGFFKK